MSTAFLLGIPPRVFLPRRDLETRLGGSTACELVSQKEIVMLKCGHCTYATVTQFGLTIILRTANQAMWKLTKTCRAGEKPMSFFVV